MVGGGGRARVGTGGLGRVRRARRLWARVLAAAVASVALPARVSAQDAVVLPREVVDLRFEGARAFPVEQLRTAIETRKTGCGVPLLCYVGIGRDHQYLENPAVLNADVFRLRTFYAQRGYRDAQIDVDTIPSRSGIEVVFRIDEREPVRVTTLEVDGAAGFLPDDITDWLPLRRGDPLNLIMVEAARDSLISALRNRGYPRAEVLVDQIFIPAQSREAEVRYLVIPGTDARFGRIEIIGHNQVSEDLIRQMLTFSEGDVYRQSELLTSQRNVYGLGFFQNVSIQPLLGEATDTIVPIRIQVNEGNTRRIRVGGGFNNLDCINAEGRWTNSNFFGGARRLELRGAVTNVLAQRLFDIAGLCERGQDIDPRYRDLSGSLSADFTQPWFLGPRNTLGAGLFIERQSLPGVFIRSARGGYLNIVRTISARTSLGLAFRPELTELDAVGNELVFCMSYIACAINQVDVLGEPHWLNPIALSFTRDRSNLAFFPTRGYILRLETEYAAPLTGSEFAYFLAAGDVASYRDIGSGVILATHLRAGWAKAIEEPGTAEGLGLHPQKRFFAGGANSVRGFAQYRLGPKVLHVEPDVLLSGDGVGQSVCTVDDIAAGECDASALARDAFDVRPVGGDLLFEGSVELRFPLSRNWRGAAFVDFGQVWQVATQDGVGSAATLGNIVVSPGLGIRYGSPIGPIRVDVGFNGQGEELLPVVTTDQTGRLRFQKPYAWSPGGGFFDRLQFHFSIGQAF